ncbi:MAG: hypothetical protein WA405_09410 [Candidatus Acidiferrales bacterium]
MLKSFLNNNVLALVAAEILLTWVLCTAVLIGLGSLILRNFGGGCRLLDEFWMGLAVAVLTLEVWSLLRPVTPAAALLLTAAGVLGLVWNRKGILRQSEEVLKGLGLPVLVYILIAAYIALRSCGPCDYYDTGLYGAQSVHWIVTYPAVLGLANLHWRLGINSSVFLCDAAMRQGAWPSLYFHFFTGLMLAALWAAIFPSIIRLVRGAPASAADYFQAFLAIPASSWAVRSKIVGTLTDEPAAVACLFAAGILFGELSREEGENRGEHDSHARLIVAASLAALAISFKLSVIVFAALAWAVVLIWLCSFSRQIRRRGAWITASIVLPAAILFPWLIRGFMLSGYPFFPSAMLGIPADWRVPAALANIYTGWVHSFAVNQAYELAPPGKITVLGKFGGAARWILGLMRNREAFQVPFLLSIAGAAALLVCGLKPAHMRRNRALWLLLPSLGGIAFWLAEAPDPRFGQAAIWTLAATLGSLGIVASGARLKWLRPRLVAAGLLLAMLWCLFSYGWQQSYRPLESVREMVPLSDVRVVARQTASGLIVYIPAEGNQCWDAPVPCTPYFDDTLRLRSPGNLGGGFVSEGLPELPEN